MTSYVELPTGLLGIPAAAQWLDVSENSLRKLVSAKKVPFTRVGKHVKFSSEHLLAIIRQGEVRPDQATVPKHRPRRRYPSAA